MALVKWQRGSAHYQMEKISAGKFHCEPPSRFSLDHLVGANHQCHRHLEPDCPCGLEVDDQLEFRRLLYRKTGGTSAAKNFVDVDGGTTIKVGVARPIRDQPSGIDVLLRDVDCGQPMTRRHLRDKASIFLREGVDADDECVCMLCGRVSECRRDVLDFSYVQQLRSKPQFSYCCL